MGTPAQRTTTPRTFTSTLSSFEELASTVNDLSNSISSGRGSGRGFARVRNGVVTSAAPGRARERSRGRTRARQRGSSERRKKPKIQDESSTENLAEPELGEFPEASRVASLCASHLRTYMSTAPVWSNVGKDVRATINS